MHAQLAIINSDNLFTTVFRNLKIVIYLSDKNVYLMEGLGTSILECNASLNFS